MKNILITGLSLLITSTYLNLNISWKAIAVGMVAAAGVKVLLDNLLPSKNRKRWMQVKRAWAKVKDYEPVFMVVELKDGKRYVNKVNSTIIYKSEDDNDTYLEWTFNLIARYQESIDYSRVKINAPSREAIRLEKIFNSGKGIKVAKTNLIKPHAVAMISVHDCYGASWFEVIPADELIS